MNNGPKKNTAKMFIIYAIMSVCSDSYGLLRYFVYL